MFFFLFSGSNSNFFERHPKAVLGGGLALAGAAALARKPLAKHLRIKQLAKERLNSKKPRFTPSEVVHVKSNRSDSSAAEDYAHESVRPGKVLSRNIDNLKKTYHSDKKMQKPDTSQKEVQVKNKMKVF